MDLLSISDLQNLKACCFMVVKLEKTSEQEIKELINLSMKLDLLINQKSNPENQTAKNSTPNPEQSTEVKQKPAK